jgi:hypothetical protein
MHSMIRCIFVSAVLSAGNAGAFVVSNTNDSGAGSLRQAILDANAVALCEMQTIAFAIPGAGVHTIRPTSQLPALGIPTTIDGYSQPGAQMNSLNQGENAQLMIELDGSLAGNSSGIVVAGNSPLKSCSGNGSLIRGLVINRFQSAGVLANGATCLPTQFCNVGGIYIYGNFIGTDPTGMIAEGNGYGIYFGLNSEFNQIGDALYSGGAGGGGSYDPLPLIRNIISGNIHDGIYLGSSNASFPSITHRMRGNYIGVDATGANPLGNGGHGIFSDANSGATQIADNVIGASGGDGIHMVGNLNGYFAGIVGNGIGVGIGGASVGNAGDGVFISADARAVAVAGQFHYLLNAGKAAISHNGGAGVYIEGAGSGVDVQSAIAGNGGLGIDLAPRGVNANDLLDVDNGPNELLNAPVLKIPTAGANSMVNISGTIDTKAGVQVEIDIFRSDACDSSGFGEGQVAINFARVTTDGAGHADFSQDEQLSPGQAVTAMTRQFATTPNDSTFIVSEFSNCQVIGEYIFADGFGP